MQNGTPGSFRPRVTHVVSQMVKKGEVRLLRLQSLKLPTPELCVSAKHA